MTPWMVKNGEEKSSSLQQLYMKLYINQRDSLPNSIGPNGKCVLHSGSIQFEITVSTSIVICGLGGPLKILPTTTTSATTHTPEFFSVHHRLCDRHPCQLSACLESPQAGRGGMRGTLPSREKLGNPPQKNMNLGGTNPKLHSERLLKVRLPP